MLSTLAAFEPHRPRLLRIAFRMLGTMTDAEDVVQDAYVRWHESERSEVLSVEAVLVKTVVRLAIDRQRKRKTERSSYHGSWLPEPWLGDGTTTQDPGLGKENLGYAALVLLERLGPEDRAAFVMREVFDLDYDFIANTLEKSEPACRKLVQRARERLSEASTDEPQLKAASREAHHALVSQLLAASRAQTAAELEQILTHSVRLVSDGGGKVFAAREALHGSTRVANTLWRFKKKLGARLEEQVIYLSGEPVIVSRLDGALYSILFLEVFIAADTYGIRNIFLLLNPDKLPSARFLVG